MLTIRVNRKARSDLRAQYAYFQIQSGIELADRFLAAADATFQFLAEFPTSGARYQTELAPLQDVASGRFMDFLTKSLTIA